MTAQLDMGEAGGRVLPDAFHRAETVTGLRRHWPLGGTALAGLVLSILTFVVTKDYDLERIRTVLEKRVEWRTLDIQAKLGVQTEPMMAVASLIRTMGEVEPMQFQLFADEVFLHGVTPRALIWAPRVTAAERNSFETEAQTVAGAGYHIHDNRPDGSRVPAGRRDEYFPALHVRRYEAIPNILGLDMTTFPDLRAAIPRAENHGGPIVVQQISTVTRRPIYLVVWPVYHGTVRPGRADGASALLRGVLVASYDFIRVLDDAIQGTPDIITVMSMSVEPDTTATADKPKPAVPIAVYDPEAHRFLPPDQGEGLMNLWAFRMERSFAVNGLRWHLDFFYRPDDVRGMRSHIEWSWLIVGLLLTAGAGVVVERLQRLRFTAEIAATHAGAALTRAGADLDAATRERQSAQAKLTETVAALEAVITTAPSAIISLDLIDGTVLTWNSAAELQFGYTAGEVIGRPYPLVPPEEMDGHLTLRSQTLDGKVPRNVLAKRRRKDGRIIDVRLSGARVRDASGRTVGVFVLDDVTGQLAVERQLRQAQKMEAVGNLTGGMAHDFNNLLLVILGNLDHLVARVRDDPEAVELAQAALEAGERGADLTRALLAFARRQPLQPKTIDANALVQGMTKLMGRTLGEDIEIDLHLADGVWQVRADPAQLESALLNLAVNARDAMPQGGRLTIATVNRPLDADYASAHADVESGDYVAIEVSDTGTGMTAEVQQRIFEPFFTTKGIGKGTGLGLAMVFGFVKQSGGHLNVYSEVGHGTTFRLYLPRHAAAKVAAAAAEIAGATAASGRETVLVVDDDARVRQIVVRNMRELGYRVIERSSAADALAELRGGAAVDLLFTDVVMPGGMNGFALASQAKAERSGLKVLLTSGFPDAALKASGSVAADTPLLTKPYRMTELGRKLREVLDGQT